MRFGGVLSCIVLVGVTLGNWVQAQAPDRSLRPMARPGSVSVAAQPTQIAPSAEAQTVTQTTQARPANVRPQMRPKPRLAVTASVAQPVVVTRPSVSDQRNDRAGRNGTPQPAGTTGRQASQQPDQRVAEQGGIFKSLRPLLRPRAVQNQAVTRKKQQARGAVCGDLAIQGVHVGAVPGRLGGCGVEDAVKVHSISGVALTMRSVMDCTTAKTLKAWIDRGMQPAVGNRGGGVANIHVAAHYACRTRNNQKGKKISEHGKGRAIDISGFTLNDGSTIKVLTDWGKGRNGQILRRMHQTACGPFGTVLGPEANKFHRDHFHFDTARYRSGSYCR
ncbi:extensin family protein [Rhodobacteraceae bacterium KMM 6894]|nr:extensin family protein [Rhodobacteraceae bacterium KMM 6894]